MLPGEIDVSNLKKLLDLLKTNYDQIVIDLPRLIDPMSNMVMELSDQITLVCQQSLDQFRDVKRLVSILNKDLDVPLEKISIAVNRYNPKSSLRIEDLKHIINTASIYTIANDFEHVVRASDLGIPLCESSPHSKIAQDIKKLAKDLGKVEFHSKQNDLLHRFKSFLFS